MTADETRRRGAPTSGRGPLFGSPEPRSSAPVVLVPPGGHRSRAGWLLRCARCAMHVRLCLCAELEPLPLALRVVVICTVREARRPTNTGRLVPLLLAGGEARVRGLADAPLRTDDLVDPARRTLLLFPGPDSRELRRDPEDPRPITLVVPDGTWRAARKMTTREPALAGIERVHLPAGPPSRYRLRSHPDPRYLATLEAVARALGLLEQCQAQQHLERALTLFVERTLWTRGRLRAGRVTGGIPAAREG